MSNRRAGREFMTMEESETPVAPCLFAESPSNYVATLSEQGRMLLFQMTELKYQPKGRGMILMGLDKNEKMVAAMVSDQQKLVVMGTVRGKPNTVLVQGKELGQYAGHRTRMGKMLPDKIKPTALKLYTPDPAKS
jgi:topoisomerase-4 subunit A